jgi:hypothetical protein
MTRSKAFRSDPVASEDSPYGVPVLVGALFGTMYTLLKYGEPNHIWTNLEIIDVISAYALGGILTFLLLSQAQTETARAN